MNIIVKGKVTKFTKKKTRQQLHETLNVWKKDYYYYFLNSIFKTMTSDDQIILIWNIKSLHHQAANI